MNEELKPCPFCGSGAVNVYKSEIAKDKWFVVCDDCGASLTNGHLSRSSTIETWNTRPSANDLEASLSELWDVHRDTLAQCDNLKTELTRLQQALATVTAERDLYRSQSIG